MKKNIFIVLAATAAYSYLFYQQSYGINHLVFSVVFTAALAFNNPASVKSQHWWMAAAVYLLSGIMTALNGSVINLLMNLGGMGLLAYVTVARDLSVITGITYAAASSICATMVAAALRLEKIVSTKPATETNNEPDESQKTYKWYYLIIPVSVLLLFVVLYRNASGAFTHLTNQIDLSFISFTWIFFTLMGFQFMYGFLNPPAAFDFFKRETKFPNKLQKNPRWITAGFNHIGLTLFLLLNVLLLVVDITDLVYMFFIGKENIHMSHAELIHQGIASLSISIVFAIIFILLWLNQLKNEDRLVKRLRLYASIWVVLNILLVGTNAFKNYEYIAAHGLTYLRIGVYFFLTLALCALFFCWIKISGGKTNYFMYRRFGLVFLITCCIFNSFNWDRIIAQYNITRYKAGSLAIDAEYMLSLSDDCLPTLMENWGVINPNELANLNNILKERCEDFIDQFEKKDWRSLTWNNYMTRDYLEKTPINPWNRSTAVQNEQEYETRPKNRY